MAEDKILDGKELVPEHHRKALWVGLGVALLVLVSATLAYATDFRDPVSVGFKKLYPEIFVGINTISIDEIDNAIAVAKRINSQFSKTDVQNMLIKHKKMEMLVEQLNAQVDDNEIADEASFYTKGKEDDYINLVSQYFMDNEGLMKKFVIYPSAYEAALKIAYNSNFEANKSAYEKVQRILGELNSGSKFEDLAKKDSEDTFTAQLGGDLGFFEHGQILPELEREITVSAVGEVRKGVVVSRQGYHIIYPVEIAQKDDTKLWHVKHILVKTNGFDEWFENQTRGFKVRKLRN